MKKFLLGTVGLVALGMASAPASAADLAARPYTKAPPMMMAAYDWSGFYIGGNGGWGQTHDDRSNNTIGLPLGSHDASGGTAGGQIGYRWQSAGWVFGLEAQGNWADFSDTSASTISGIGIHNHMDAFGLFTGQIGYAWNNVLVYAKGGAAVTDTSYSFTGIPSGGVLSSTGYDTDWGATVGAGIEYGFAPNWSVAFEYDHIFMDTKNRTFTTPTGAVLPASFGTGGDTDLATVRLNYKFGYGAPLLAKY